MASSLQRGLLSFGMEMEMYVQPKDTITEELVLQGYNPTTHPTFAARFKTQNRKVVLKFIARALTIANIPAIVPENEVPEKEDYGQWQVKTDASLHESPEAGYCELLTGHSHGFPHG